METQRHLGQERLRQRLWPILILVFFSGLCAVSYQMAWLRLLRLIFGASTLANATVLAIFMGGLGLGGLVLGRRVDAARRPLALYAALELTIGIAAAATPVLLLAVRWIYLELGGIGVLGWFGGNLVRLLLSAFVLGVPTFLMGGTLPAVVRALEHQGDRARRSMGLLYGLNTVGAVGGALWVTFAGTEILGTDRVIWIAALTNLILGICARSMARRLADRPDNAGEPGREEGAYSAGAVPARGSLVVILGGAGLVGFVFFVMELVWYRMLAPLLGGSSYSFGLILAVALAGIGVGGTLYGLGAQRRRPSLELFALTCALEAACVIVPLALGDRVAFLALVLRALGEAGFSWMVVGWALVTLVVVFPAATVAGYQFPVLVAALGEGRESVGWQVGLTYGANTLGSILGAIAGGFVLIPGIGAVGAWRVATLLLVALALGTAWRKERRGVPVGASLIAVCVLLLLAAPGPTAAWRHGGIGAGRLVVAGESANDVVSAFQERRDGILWEDDGVESSVALDHGNGLAFLVNGKSDGSARGDAPTMVMAALVPALLHPDPQDALVIGLGTGASAGWMGAVSSITHVDVVELEPAIVRVAEACAAVNRDVLDNPKVEIHDGDGREYLLASKGRYDVVFSEPSNPYRAGVSSLFTLEFYRAVAQHLNQRGLLAQWLQGYEVDAEVVRTAYATLHAVFPFVESWQVADGDLLLIASRQPIDHDVDRIARLVSEEPFASALSQVWGVQGVAGFYAGFVGRTELAAALSTKSRGLNTDDRPLIEFGFARNLGRHGLFSIRQLRDLAFDKGWDRPRLVSGSLNWHEVRDAASALSATLGAPTGGVRPDVDPNRAAAREALRAGRFVAALHLWQGQSGAVEHRIDRLLVSAGLAESGSDQAPAAFEELARIQPTEAMALRGLWHARRQEWPEAADDLEKALVAYRTDPWPLELTMAPVLRETVAVAREDPAAGRRLFDAMAQPFAVSVLNRVRRSILVQLAGEVDFAGLCQQAFEQLEPHPWWLEPVLSLRVACYQATDDARLARARSDLARFDRAKPPALMVDMPEPPNADSDPSAGLLPVERTP